MPRDGRSASAAVPDSAAAAASSTADASSNHNNSTNTGNSSTAEPTSIKSKLKLRVAQYRTQRDRKKGGSAPVTNPPNSRHSLKAKSKKGKGESLGASESEEEEQQEQPNPDQVEAGKRQDEASSTETGEANSARTTTEGELSEGGATAGSESIDARDASVDAESPHMKRKSSPEKVGGKTALAAANSADEAVQGSSGSDSKKGGHSSGNNSASKEISATAHDTEVVPSSASSFAESEDDPVPARLPGKERFVSYFFVVGIDEQMTPMETPNPVPVLQRPYTGRLVELFPRHTKEDPFPDHVWLFCFPRGVQLRVATDQPAPITFPFVLTTLSGDKLFGQGLTMYERLSNNAKARLNVDDAAIIEAAAVSSGSVQNDSSKLEVWTPRCVCLLSQWPFFSTFREWLAEFYDRIFSRKLPIPIEEYIIDIVMRVPLPPPRFDVLIEFSMHEKWLSVARPPRGMFDDGGIPLAMLFKVLSLQNVFTVLRAVLLEERILLVSRRMTLLTYAAETLRMILYPFAWPHVYIPVLPHNLIEFAAYTPLPFIIGVPRETLPLITSLSDASPEIFIVDLDNNTVSTPVPLLKLPEPEFSELRRDLTALLYRDVDALDNPCQPGPRVNALSASESSVMTSAHIACAFRRFFASMMKDYREYLLYLRVFPQPVAMFDTAKFVAARTAEASKMDASDVSSAEEDGGARSDQELREFFEAFMETQAFQVFLEDHNWPTPNAFDSMIDQRTYELPFHECLAKLAGSFLPSRDRPETLPGGRLRVEHIRILPRHKKMAGAPFVYSQFPVLNKEVLRSAEGLRPITVGGAAKLPNSSGNHAEQESPLNQKHHAPQEKSTEGSERVSKRIRAIVKSPIESTQPPLSEKRLASLIQTFSSSEGRDSFARELNKHCKSSSDQSNDGSESTADEPSTPTQAQISICAFEQLSTLICACLREAIAASDLLVPRNLLRPLFAYHKVSVGAEVFLFADATIRNMPTWQSLDFWENSFFSSLSDHMRMRYGNIRFRMEGWAQVSTAQQRETALEEQQKIFDVASQFAFYQVQLGTGVEIIRKLLSRTTSWTELEYDKVQTLNKMASNMITANELMNADLPDEDTQIDTLNPEGHFKLVGARADRGRMHGEAVQAEQQVILHDFMNDRSRTSTMSRMRSTLAPLLASRRRKGRDTWLLLNQDNREDYTVTTLRGHESPVLTVALEGGSNSERKFDRVFSGSCDSTVRIWNASDASTIAILRGHTGWVNCLLLEGDKLISGSYDRSIKLWDAHRGTKIKSLRGHSGAISALASSLGQTPLIVSASYDSTMRMWDPRHPKRPVQSNLGHKGPITCLSVFGERILSGSRDGTLRLWDVRKGAEVCSLEGHEDWISCCALVGNDFAVSGSCDTTARIWTAMSSGVVPTPLLLSGHHNPVTSINTRNGTVTTTTSSGEVRLWDAEEGRCMFGHRAHGDEITTCGTLTTNGRSHIVTGSSDCQVKLWSVSNDSKPADSKLKQVRKNGILRFEHAYTLSGHRGKISSMTTAGNRIVTGSWDYTVRVWEFDQRVI